MPVKKKILNGLGSGGFGVIVTLLTQILLVPIFLSYWGEQRYAIWLVIFAVPTYLSLTDLGLINVLTNKALRFFSINRNKIGSRYIYSAFTFIVPVSLLLSFFIYSICYFVLPVKFTSLDLSVYIYLAVYSSLLLISNLLVGSFRAVRLFHIGSLGVNTLRLIDFFVILISLINYKGEEYIAVWLTVLRLVGVSFLFYMLFSYLNKEKGLVSIKLIYLNLKSSLNYFLIPMSSMAINQGVLMIVGVNYSPQTVIIFNSIRILFRMMTLVTSVFINAFRQEVSRMYYKLNKSYFNITTKLALLNLVITMFFCTFYILFGDMVLYLWLGSDFHFSSLSFYLILVFVAINNLNLTNLMIINSTNLHERFSKNNFIITLFFMFFFMVINEFYILLVLICFYELVILYIAYLAKRKIEVYKFGTNH